MSTTFRAGSWGSRRFGCREGDCAGAIGENVVGLCGWLGVVLSRQVVFGMKKVCLDLFYG